MAMENFSAVRDEYYISADTVVSGVIVSPSSCIASVLASVLERTVGRNDRMIAKSNYTLNNNQYRVFNVDRVPEMSIERYLHRILKHTSASPSVFVVAYAYIDRLCAFHPEFRITSLNVHRLLITVVMVASKFLEDLNYRNSYYGAVGGLEVDEINEMEMEFLFLIKFKLQVTVSVYESYCSHVKREVGMGGGYQIERTLRMVCGSGSGRHDQYSTHTALNSESQQQHRNRMAVTT